MNHVLARSRSLRSAGLLTALCLFGLLAAASPATARTALAKLHVEGPDGTLDPGTWYVTGTERIRRSGASDACPRRKGRIKVPGPTAMGLPQTASDTNPALRQVRVRRDEGGLFVCEIASVLGRPFSDPAGFAGWTFWQDFVFASAPADQVRLRGGERILWLFADFGANEANTGLPLELRSVDPGTTDGHLVVRVVSHDFDGAASPVAGATIEGALTSSYLGAGRYEVTVPTGFTALQATRPSELDVPSEVVETCSRPKPSACPRAHGRTIVGSRRADRLAGTKGWDEITARAGDDVVDLARGGKDTVRCGAGRDVVIGKGRGDSIARDCERARRG